MEGPIGGWLVCEVNLSFSRLTIGTATSSPKNSEKQDFSVAILSCLRDSVYIVDTIALGNCCVLAPGVF